MQQNTIYRQVYRRANPIADFLFEFFIVFSSWFRLLLEVIIRRNMGDRYFKLSSAVIVGLLLFFYPIAAEKFPFLTATRPYLGYRGPSILSQYWSWYLFLIVYIAGAYWRWREVRRNPSVLNGGRCSIYTGDIHPFFFDLHPFGRKVTARQVECFFEPFVFFIAGYILNLMGQRIGILFIISGVFYALGYVGMYRKADNYLKDIMDEQVYASEMENVILNDNPNNAKGVRVHGSRPNDPNTRKQLATTLASQFHDVSYVS